MTKYDSSGKFIGRKPAADDGRRLTPDMIPERHKRTLAGLVGEPDACWLMRNPSHQMCLSSNKGCVIQAGAHKVAAALAFGGVPEGKVVRHTCDDPRCCNPKHLVICTQAENHADMMAKGRHRRLTTEQRHALHEAKRRAYAEGRYNMEYRRGAGHPCARTVLDSDGKAWPTASAAAIAHRTVVSTICRRCEKNKHGWSYVGVSDYLDVDD